VRQNIILDKSFDFAVEVIHFCRWLKDDRRELVLGKQLLRCGTSIGANVEESIEELAKGTLSPNFRSLIKRRETRYWLRAVDRYDACCGV